MSRFALHAVLVDFIHEVSHISADVRRSDELPVLFLSHISFLYLYAHGPRSLAHRPPAMLSSRQMCFNAVS